MQFQSVVQALKNNIHIKYETAFDAYLVAPFFFRHSSESVSLKLYLEDESVFISDCANTYEYLQNRYIDAAEYREKIERIKKRFYLKETPSRELYLEFPSENELSVLTFLSFFLQGISLISNVDL